jgi:hypothetical protein
MAESVRFWTWLVKLASPVVTVCLTSRHEIFGQPTCFYIAKRKEKSQSSLDPDLQAQSILLYVVFSQCPVPSSQRAGALSCWNHDLTVPVISPSNPSRKDSRKIVYLWTVILSGYQMGALEKVLYDIIRNVGHEEKLTPTLWDSRIILYPVNARWTHHHTATTFVWPKNYG